MTDKAARTVANLIVVSAGAAAAYVVVSRPPVRRALFAAMRLWLVASIPLDLLAEARRAWAESPPRSLR